MAKIAEEIAASLVDEKQQIAVGIAHQMRHGLHAGPNGNRAMRVGEQNGAFQWRARGSRRLGVEGAGAERALERGPAGGRVAVVEMRRRAIEAVTPDLPLEYAV